MLIVVSLFLNSIRGGLIWDEPSEFDKVKTQLEFARDVLFGTTNWTFRSFLSDYAFYGIGAVLPAHALSYLIARAVSNCGRMYVPPHSATQYRPRCK
jgi:hypothetical protein